MYRTLFFIPHFLFEDHWLLIGWVLFGLAVFGYLFFKYGSGKEVWNFVPVFLVVAAVIHFLLPGMEISGIDSDNPNGDPVKLGLAIQGYGVFMLLGMVTGVGISLWRAHWVGFDVDRVLTVIFCMIVCGLIGARLFYVIQKWDEFGNRPPDEMLAKIVDMTKGGLVVYGSLIGGVIGALIFLRKSGMPVLKLADVVGPGMVLGLAFGRLGCLMNGCCFGNVCHAEVPSIEFPPGSPPYMEQVIEGDLLGLTLKPLDKQQKLDEQSERVVVAVKPESVAAKLKLKPGDQIEIYTDDGERIEAAHLTELKVNAGILIRSERLGDLTVPAQALPKQSLPTHPTQIYSSINAFCLCLLLWFYFPFRKSNGEVFALLLILYAIGRFLLEAIRTDELGLFGTPFTISQWISLFGFAMGLALFWYCRNRFPVTDAQLKTA